VYTHTPFPRDPADSTVHVQKRGGGGLRVYICKKKYTRVRITEV